MPAKYSESAQRLVSLLGLEQTPIAIRFTDSLTQGLAHYPGVATAGCRFWQDASSGSFATSSENHALCAIGVYTHNLAGSPQVQTDLEDALAAFSNLGYVRPQDLRAIPVLSSRARHVIYAPLAETDVTPEVVLLFVKPNQMLVLSEAAQQVDVTNAPSMGRPACAVVPQVINSGQAALSLGCCGARAYLDVLTPEVAIFALPGAKLPEYLERIRVLAQANATLSRFHELRRNAIEAGHTPSIQESLAALSA